MLRYLLCWIQLRSADGFCFHVHHVTVITVQHSDVCAITAARVMCSSASGKHAELGTSMAPGR